MTSVSISSTTFDAIESDSVVMAVYDLCRKSQWEDKPLLELLRQHEDIKRAGLTDEDLQNLCDPANYLGLSEVMVDRVLNTGTNTR